MEQPTDHDLLRFHERVAALIDADRRMAAEAAQVSAVHLVLAERQRQDSKWGEQNLDPITYLAVLTEEAGELSQAALHARFGGPAAAKLLTEAVHTAAVGLAIVECLLRNLWQWPVPVQMPPAAPPEGEPAPEAVERHDPREVWAASEVVPQAAATDQA